MVDAGAAVELALNTQGEAISPVNPSTGIVMGNVRGYDDDHQVVELNDVNVSAYRISDYDGNLLNMHQQLNLILTVIMSWFWKMDNIILIFIKRDIYHLLFVM